MLYLCVLFLKEVTCEDEILQKMVQAAVSRLHNTVTPLNISNTTM